MVSQRAWKAADKSVALLAASMAEMMVVQTAVLMVGYLAVKLANQWASKPAGDLVGQ